MDDCTAEQLLHTEFARTLRKPFRQAVSEYRLLREGDRVAACISGGKDSMLLALLLRDLSRELPLELAFLAMDPGYTPEHRRKIEDNAARLGLPLHVFETNVLRRREPRAGAPVLPVRQNAARAPVCRSTAAGLHKNCAGASL